MRDCTLHTMATRILSVLIIIICSAGCSNNGTTYTVIDGFAQGGTYHIVYQSPKDAETINLPDSLTQYFYNIDKSLSGYDSTSIVSKINRGENPPLDSLFIECFNISKQIWEETSGKVDISGGPLFDIWGFGFREKVEITPKMIDSIRQFIGMDKLTIAYDSSSKASFLKKGDPRMTVNFNAIAQGFTCDYIAGKLDGMGIENYLIEVGGEIICKGVNKKGEEWNIAIDKPVDGNFIPGNSIQTIIGISNRSLVTSGNYRKFYIKDGEKFSHTIDPETGSPVKHNLLSATVLAPDAATADAYATYLMVIGLEPAIDFLKKESKLDALLVYSQGEELKVYSTSGVRQKELKQQH